MKFCARAAAAAFAAVMTVPLAVAHHALPAEYDLNKSVTIVGKVTRIEWTNPHARFYVDVREQNGKTTTWEFQLGSPNGLMRRGWSSKSLKAGDVVTVSGFLARDGAHLVSTTAVHLSDGREVFAGSASDGSPVDRPAK